MFLFTEDLPVLFGHLSAHFWLTETLLQWEATQSINVTDKDEHIYRLSINVDKYKTLLLVRFLIKQIFK